MKRVMILVERAFEDDGDVVQAAVDLDVASRPDIVALFRIVAVVTFPRIRERDAQIMTRVDAGAMFSASRYSHGRQRLAVRGDLRRRLAGPGQLPPRLEPVV